MAKQRSAEVKVGIFVLVSLVAIAGLVIKFGKLERFSAKTYDIIVVFPNVGGIVRDANVMYAGLPVGKVRDIKLSETGALRVRVTLAIYEGYSIRRDAKFVINQSGLLGDRYVDVIPQSATAAILKPGEEIEKCLVHLLNRTLSFNTQVRGGDVLIDMVIEVDDVGLGGFRQNRRVRRRNHAKLFLIHQFHHHLQNSPLIGLRERHLRLVEQQHGLIG